MDPEEELRREAARRRGFDTAEDVAASEARKGPAAHSAEGIPFGGSERVRAIAEAHPELAPSVSESLDRAIGEALGPGDALARAPRAVRRVGSALASTPAAPAAEYGAQWLESGTAPTSGAVMGASSGLADEIAGLVGGAAEVSRGGDFVPGYERRRDAVRARSRRDEEEHPIAFGAGEAGGALAQGLLIPGSGATTATGRMAAATGTGAGLGALSAFGHSERTGGELLHDTAAGGLAGGLGGAVFSGLGELGSASGRGATRMANRADLMRTIAPAGGLVEGANRMRSLGPASRTAELLREMGIGGPGARVQTAEEMAEAAHAAERALGSEIGALRRRIGESTTIPVSVLRESMERYADEIGGTTTGAPMAEAVRARAEALTDLMGDGTIPYARAVEELQGLQRTANWTTRTGVPVAPSTRMTRGLSTAVRDSLDEYLAPRVPREVMEAYTRARPRYGVATRTAGVADAAAARNLTNRGLSPTDYAMLLGVGSSGYLAGGGGASGGLTAGLAALGAAAGNHSYRLREPALRAAGSEALRGLLRNAPEGLGEIATPALRAASRAASSMGGESWPFDEEGRAPEEAGDTGLRLPVTPSFADVEAAFAEPEGEREPSFADVEAVFDEEGTDR